MHPGKKVSSTKGAVHIAVGKVGRKEIRWAMSIKMRPSALVLSTVTGDISRRV